MDDAIRSEIVEGAGDGVGVGDRILDDGQRLVLGQVVTTPRREVVDDENLMTVSQQPIGEVGADKPAPARDQNLHPPVLSLSAAT